MGNDNKPIFTDYRRHNARIRFTISEVFRKILEELGDIDILFLPVGEVSTIPIDAAAEIVRQLRPPIVIPMHYRTEAYGASLSPVDQFLEKMRLRDVEPSAKLSITSSSLSGNTQVIVLTYPHS